MPHSCLKEGKYEANDSPSVQYGERVLSCVYTPTDALALIRWTHQCVETPGGEPSCHP